MSRQQLLKLYMDLFHIEEIDIFQHTLIDIHTLKIKDNAGRVMVFTYYDPATYSLETEKMWRFRTGGKK